MKIVLKPTDPVKLDADVLISFCWENELSLSGFPKELSATVRTAAQKEDFHGKEGQTLVLSGAGLISSYKFMLFGLGKTEDFSIYKLYSFIASAIGSTRSIKAARAVIIPEAFWIKKYGMAQTLQIMGEAATLSSYAFLKYKGEEEKRKLRPLEEIYFAVDAGKLSQGETGIHTAGIFSEAVIFARDLINEPPEYTSPQFLSDKAQEIEKESNGLIKVKIMEKDEIAKSGMNAFLGVASGSDKPPKFIRLSYRPAGTSKKVVVIGKGITFDTGGLSLKSAEHMETMKLDMAGAAAVLAIFKALSVLKPKAHVVGLIAACENMPSGRALKPGDILRSMNGKTIEVLNTDAEGRLTLADVISYAVIEEKPDEIIDLATLTGACMVALGEEIAGMWSSNDKMAECVVKAAEKCGELVWRMPLFAEYKKLIKSHIADIKNTQTGRYGGAVTAALFLSEFVGATPWVHLDIAGPAYAEKNTPLCPQGGVGFGVRTILNYLLEK